MIVKMKKVFLLIRKHQASAALDSLGALGIVHVEHENVPAGIHLNAISEKLSLIEQAQAVLVVLPPAGLMRPQPAKSKDLYTVCRHAIDLQKRYEQLREYSVTLRSGIDLWEHWGDFDPAQITALREHHIFIKLYQVPKDKIKSLPAVVLVKKVSTQGALINCLIASTQETKIDFKELELPKMSLAGMKNRLSEDAKIMRNIREELAAYRIYDQDLIAARSLLLNQKDFYSVLNGMGQTDELVYLKGYIPVDAEELLLKQAKQNGWGILTLEPGADDAVPTLLRNPAWISTIKPLLKLLELTPGYRELDISPLFIIFFGLFFGMLIGDAGYGLVYLTLTFWLHKKMKDKIKDQNVFFLFYILSFCAIIWGLLTGTFFGQEWLLKLGLKPLFPVLTNTVFIQKFCFLIGALHLTLAHGWKVILAAPALVALAELGWIFIIWAVFFLANNLILGDKFPLFGNQLIIIGLALVLFFTNPQKNILKTIGSGLGTIALSLVNNFTDVVSYIRLFAVGLAGVAIADAFNTMAAGVVQSGNFVTLIVAALIVICGHLLNIILGPMSVLVHGVRLNVLEFCGHLGVTWSGFAYKPFTKNKD